MSDLPEGWEWARLNEIAEVRLGRQRSPKNHSGTQMRPYLRAANVGWDGLKLDDVKSMNFADAEFAIYKLEPGDIVLAEASGSPSEVGKPALWKGEIADCCLQNTLIRVRSYGVEPSYLVHYLRAEAQRGAFVEKSRGVGIHHLGAAKLADWPIPVPPLGEQHRIVATIEDHLSRLEAGRDFIASAKVKAGLFRSAFIDEIVLGTRLGDSQSDNQSFSVLKPKGATKIDYTQLPSLPQEWKWRVASDVCESIACGGTPKSDLMYADRGDVPFLKVYNLTKRGVLDFSVRPTFIDRSTHNGQLRRSQVRPGDVLTNIVGPPLGKTSVVPKEWPEWNINQAIVAFRAGPDVTPDWLALVLQSPLVLGLLERTARATAGQFNVSLSTCRALPLPVPPKPQQLALVSQAGELLDHAERSSAAFRLIAQRGQHLRKKMLAEAFAGQLVEQDPDDEPASVLLERIRAERTARPIMKRGRRSRKSESGQGSLL